MYPNGVSARNGACSETIHLVENRADSHRVHGKHDWCARAPIIAKFETMVIGRRRRRHEEAAALKYTGPSSGDRELVHSRQEFDERVKPTGMDAWYLVIVQSRT